MENTFITKEQFYEYFGEIPVEQEDFVLKLLTDTFNIILAQCDEQLYYDWKNNNLTVHDLKFLQDAQKTLCGWFLENDFFAKAGSTSAAQASKSLSQGLDNNKEVLPLFYQILEKTRYYSDYIDVENPFKNQIEIPETIPSSRVRDNSDEEPTANINVKLNQVTTNQTNIGDMNASQIPAPDNETIIKQTNYLFTNTTGAKFKTNEKVSDTSIERASGETGDVTLKTKLKTEEELALKANLTYVNTELDKKTSKVAFDDTNATTNAVFGYTSPTLGYFGDQNELHFLAGQSNITLLRNSLVLIDFGNSIEKAEFNTGIKVNNTTIDNVATPTQPHQGANKEYVDTQIEKLNPLLLYEAEAGVNQTQFNITSGSYVNLDVDRFFLENPENKYFVHQNNYDLLEYDNSYDLRANINRLYKIEYVFPSTFFSGINVGHTGELVSVVFQNLTDAINNTNGVEHIIGDLDLSTDDNGLAEPTKSGFILARIEDLIGTTNGEYLQFRIKNTSNSGSWEMLIKEGAIIKLALRPENEELPTTSELKIKGWIEHKTGIITGSLSKLRIKQLMSNRKDLIKKEKKDETINN